MSTSDNVVQNHTLLNDLNENSDINEYDGNRNVSRRSSVYEKEMIEYLEDIDQYYATVIKNKDGSKLYVRNKYGSKIIENPLYNEIINKKPEPGQRSLIIIFDGTGSMVDDLKQLTDGAEAIINEIIKREKNPIYNYIFVPFRDPYIGPKLVTQNLDRLLHELRNLPLTGGGDCPESAIGGINLALESALPKSFIFVFTDATANDFGLDQYTIDLIQKHQATLTFLLTGFCNSKKSEGYYVYERLAALSNGQVFNLNKTDIKDVLESIRTSLDKDLIPLDYVYSKDPGPHSIDISVDQNLKELTVSVAGKNPNITLIDPNESKPTDVNEVLVLSNLKVVNVQDPIPGIWNVETKADSEHSVKLTALSNLNFKFGFSLENPKNINETNLNPIRRIPNVLSIVPSDDNLIHNLTTVELIQFDYNPDGENDNNIMLPLEYLKSSNENSKYATIHVTKPVVPPEDMFKIYVKGYDSKGNPLKHLISTAIKAMDGEKPKISTSNNFVELLEGKSGVIECKIDTSLPATVYWKRNNELIQIDKLSGSKSFSKVFDNIKLEESGQYECFAENEYGIDEQIINVIVRENVIPITVKLMRPLMVAKEYDVDYQISCYALPSDNVNYKWFFEGSEIPNQRNIEVSSNNLLIRNIKRSNAGNYTCKASNGRSSSEDTGYLDVLFEPEFISPLDEYTNADKGEMIVLNCSAEGNPNPTAEWIFENELIFDSSTIQYLRAKVSGQYSCKISNGIGEQKVKHFYVDVREKPIIHSVVPLQHTDENLIQIVPGLIDTYKVFEGFTENFFCNATGLPEPIYQWIKKDEQMYGDDEIIFSDDEILFIDNITQSDAGNYSCIAKNDLGEDIKMINLYVVVPPKFNTIEDTVIMAENGQIIALNCNNIEGLPPPNLSWKFNNNTLDENDAYYQFENNSLSFYANFKDSGIYECLAKNEGGHVTKKFVLIVYVPPSIYPPNDEIVNSKLGETTRIFCNVEGYPKPNIDWYMNGFPIDNTEKFHLRSDNGELTLTNAEISDSGMYVCKAQNQYGVAQKNFYLNVNYIPKILNDVPSELKLLPSEIKTLNCTADSKPPATVIWKKDNQQISEEKITNILILNNTQHQHQNLSGLYVCTAQNSEGYDKKYVKIIQIEKPIVNENSLNSNKILNSTLYEDVVIHCPIKNVVNYTWYKNGIELFNENSEILKIDFVSWNERGNYTCIGKNDAGEAKYTQELNVFMTPQFYNFNSNEMNDKNNDIIENVNKPKMLELKMGDNVTLKCLPHGYPEPQVVWIKDQTELSHNSELHLNNVQIIHSGIYKCKAKNVFGENEISYNIDVLVPPSLQVPSKNWIEISENDSLKLDCNLVGNPWPFIYWMKNGVNLTEYQEILEIQNPNIDDSGVYKCVGHNHLGQNEIEFNVNILAPPKFITPKKDIKIHQNDHLELSCTVVANPLPIIAWSFNNKVLWSTSTIRLNETEEIIYTDQNGNPLLYSYVNDTINNEIMNSNQYGKLIRNDHKLTAFLVIEDPIKKKPGIYKCHSINSLGSQEADFHVQINYPPILKGIETDKKPIVNVTVLEDLPLILYCPWHGDPKPKITWMKDNQPLQSYNNVFSNDLKTLTVFHSNLNEHSGEYICSAANDLGESQKRFHVKILVPPKFETNSNDIFEEDIIPYTHTIGQQTVLECPVTGNPLPTIFWLQQKNDPNSRSSKDNFEILAINSSQLILDNIKSSGIYSCYANNSLGFIEKKYSVEVLKIPFINSDIPKQQTFKEYQTVTLNCPAEGNPKPIISWYKDGKSIQESIKTAQFSLDKTILKIPNVRKEHSGTYTCFATNTIGETRRDVHVKVKTPVIWTSWESWTPCSKSCGTGIKHRYRRCIQLTGEPANDENECKGVKYESELCEMLPCPIDGGWGEWTEWSGCPQSCTNNNDIFKPVRKRYRECNTPKPMYGGRQCSGIDYEEETCNIYYCPIDGGWSDWSSWSPCSVTCGIGKTERHRKCNNPIPSHGGSSCKGQSSDVRECSPGPCSVHGGWSEWSSWSECSKTCGTGFKKRWRTCTNPTPRNGGDDCFGENVEIAKCRKRKCLNSSLLKSLKVKNPYGPAAEYDVPSAFFQDSEEDEPVLSNEESKYQFALSSQSNLKTSTEDEQKTEYNPETGMKVVVTLKNYHPIDRNTKEISLHPGIAPFKIERIIPCPFGYEPDENNQCKDVDECRIASVCEENESCKNIDGGFICSCKSGYRFDNKEGQCIDINECSDENLNNCSHGCENTPGSYTCNCPDGYMLNPDKKSCGPDPLHHQDGFMSDSAVTTIINLTKNSDDCFEGYQLVNGVCKDVDECLDMEHDCGYEQTCLNTKGSYLCIPTPCPEEYTKDINTGICILKCNIPGDDDVKCKDETKIAELLNYVILPLNKFKITEPIYTLLNYDLNREVLINTDFILEQTIDSKYFHLEMLETKKGIAYLYANNKLKNEKLYNIRILAKSYDLKTHELIYLTKFIIYLYRM